MIEIIPYVAVTITIVTIIIRCISSIVKWKTTKNLFISELESIKERAMELNKLYSNQNYRTSDDFCAKSEVRDGTTCFITKPYIYRGFSTNVYDSNIQIITHKFKTEQSRITWVYEVAKNLNPLINANSEMRNADESEHIANKCGRLFGDVKNILEEIRK